MKTIKIDTKDLLPIQYEIRPASVRRLISKYKLKDPGIPTIDVIECKEGYLLADGHHRSCALHLMDLPAIADLYEDDKDIKMKTVGVFYLLNSIEKCKEQYEKCWKRQALNKGVASIEDLINRHKLRELLLHEETNAKKIEALRQARFI
jgi:hypothetical protein